MRDLFVILPTLSTVVFFFLWLIEMLDRRDWERVANTYLKELATQDKVIRELESRQVSGAELSHAKAES